MFTNVDRFGKNDVICTCSYVTQIQYFKYLNSGVINVYIYVYIYAVQQDTQSVLMSKFYSALMLAQHVSDLIGPSSGAFCISCIRRLWCVVILCVLTDTSIRYKVVGRTYLIHKIPMVFR